MLSAPEQSNAQESTFADAFKLLEAPESAREEITSQIVWQLSFWTVLIVGTAPSDRIADKLLSA